MIDDGERLEFVEIVTLGELAADVLNWFDEAGNLVIGCRANPEHVAEWRRQSSKPQTSEFRG